VTPQNCSIVNMDTNFACPSCGVVLLIPPEAAGRKMKCSSCAARFIAPKSQPSAPTNPNTDVPADFLPRSPLTADEPATGSNPEVTQAKESNLSRGKVQRRPLELARSESSTSSSEPDLPPPPGSHAESRQQTHLKTKVNRQSSSSFLAEVFFVLAWPLAVAMFFCIFGPNKETGHYLWIGMLGLFSFFLFAMASSNARKESHDLLNWLILLSILPAALVGYYTALAIHGNKVGSTLPRFLQSSEYKYYQELVEIGFPEAEKKARDGYSFSILNAQASRWDGSLVNYANQLEKCHPPKGSKVVSMHERYVRAIRNLSASLEQERELQRELQMQRNIYTQDANFVLRDLQLPQTPVKRAELQAKLIKIRERQAMLSTEIESAKEAAKSALEELNKAGFDLGFWFGTMNK